MDKLSHFFFIFERLLFSFSAFPKFHITHNEAQRSLLNAVASSLIFNRNVPNFQMSCSLFRAKLKPAIAFSFVMRRNGNLLENILSFIVADCAGLYRIFFELLLERHH